MTKLKNIMKIKDLYESLLSEGLSAIVYHATKLEVASKILQSGEFNLSSVVATGEESLAKKGRKFFMSVTRTKTGQYHQTWKTGCIFVLDGKAISASYTAGPVDFYGHTPHLKRTEAEDRIYSDKASLPIKSYIKQAHILIDTATKGIGKQLVKLCASKNIMPFVYTDKAAWLALDSRKAVKLDMRGRTAKEKQSGSTDTTNTPFSGWIELIRQDPTTGTLSADASKILAEYATGDRFVENDLSGALKNNARPSDQFYKDAVVIVEFMARNKLKAVSDFGDWVMKKWKEQIQQSTKASSKKTGSKYDGELSKVKTSTIDDIVAFVSVNSTEGEKRAEEIRVALARQYRVMKDFMSEIEFLQSNNMNTMQDVFRIFKLTRN